MPVAVRLAALSVLAAALVPAAGRAGAQDGETIALVGVATSIAADARADLSDDPETCARLDEDDSLEIAVFTSAVPETRGVSGFEFRLAFDPDVLQITASDPMQLLAQAEGSDVLSVGEEMSDDGELLVGVADFGRPLGVEPEGTSESGPGVLMTVTLTGGPETGLSDISLEGVIVTDDANEEIPVDSQADAQVAVNTDCPDAAASPAPTPEPRQEAEDGSGSEELAIALAAAVLAAIAGVGVAYRMRRRAPGP